MATLNFPCFFADPELSVRVSEASLSGRTLFFVADRYFETDDMSGILEIIGASKVPSEKYAIDRKQVDCFYRAKRDGIILYIHVDWPGEERGAVKIDVYTEEEILEIYQGDLPNTFTEMSRAAMAAEQAMRDLNERTAARRRTADEFARRVDRLKK